MKRRILIILLCLLIFVSAPVQAAASQTIPYVVDQAGILEKDELTTLNSLAEEISLSCRVDVFIAAVADLGGAAASDYAAALNSGRGLWDSDDAVLFLLAMEEREWYIATFGSAMYTLSDDTLDSLGETAVFFFSEGKYYDGFSMFLSMLPDIFTAQQSTYTGNSHPYAPGYRNDTTYYEPHQKGIADVLPISILIGLAAATICLLIMRSSMNTKRRQHSAGDYLSAGSFHLRTRQDIFLYSSMSKTRRQQNTGSPGGPHRSSGGRSHGGRGGRF